MSTNGPLVVFWDCDGVLAYESETYAMAVAGIILNEAIARTILGADTSVDGQSLIEQLKAAHPDAPQFDIPTFTSDYAGGHFSQFHKVAAQMLHDYNPLLTLPSESTLDAEKVARTVDVLTEKAMPAADLSAALQSLHAAGYRQCVVSSSEFNRVLPCVEKIAGYEFDGAWKRGNTGGRVFSAADTMQEVYGRRIVKPAPDIAHFAASAMGLTDYAQGIAVEDSPSGVACWVRAGIPVVGYTGGTHIADKKAHATMLMEKGAVAVFETMKEVSDYILALHQPEIVPSTVSSFKATAAPK